LRLPGDGDRGLRLAGDGDLGIRLTGDRDGDCGRWLLGDGDRGLRLAGDGDLGIRLAGDRDARLASEYVCRTGDLRRGDGDLLGARAGVRRQRGEGDLRDPDNGDLLRA
jgi:hypothetical protein